MKSGATSVLRHEHEAILKMLDATEEAASRIQQGEMPDREVLSGLVEFYRIFADQCHHGKEEGSLFPALEAKGLPRHGGPVAVMLNEHDHGRALIRKMVAASESVAQGESAAAKEWAEAALAYGSLLRQHIAKENNILFVMAEQLLSDAEQEQLFGEFEKIELEKMGAGTHERMHLLMDRLCTKIFSGARATA